MKQKASLDGTPWSVSDLLGLLTDTEHRLAQAQAAVGQAARCSTAPASSSLRSEETALVLATLQDAASVVSTLQRLTTQRQVLLPRVPSVYRP
jgi:hypothetical protein